MAASLRAYQVVRPHIPRIKFPSRAEPSTFENIDITASVSHSNTSANTPSSPNAVSCSQSKPIGSIPRGMGVEDSPLPLKYRRKPIDQTELEHIQRGGPD